MSKWKHRFWLLVLAVFVARASVPLETMSDEAPLLELQMNANFWRILSWQEAASLSEFVRDGNNAYKRVPLQYLYPMFRQVENISARSASGEQLSVEVGDLSESYLRLSPSGSVDLMLAGELQQDTVQLNVYGEAWPENKIEIWLEKDFEKPFLLAELEIYQRFHNITIELVVVEDLLQELSRRNKSEEPDMILADNGTVKLLRKRLQVFPLSEEDQLLAYLELFPDQKQFQAQFQAQFYAAPFALEPYSIIYNSDLLELDSVLTLSDLFEELEEAKQEAQKGLNGGPNGGQSDPYFVAFDDIAFTLLFQSFLKEGENFGAAGLNIPDVYAGLQYLRTQGQRGLLRPLAYAEDLFARGEVSALITRSGARGRILEQASPGKRGNKEYIKNINLPYNDLRDNAILAHPRIWSLGVLRNSAAKQQVSGLRSFLLRGAVQSQFDLSQGILPSNTRYYPFYQRSVYYPLLPKGELRYSMSPTELWEYGIKRRRDYRNTEELKDLLKERIPLLLQTDIDLELLLDDLSQQWEKAELAQKREIFY